MTNYEQLKESGQLSEFLEWMNEACYTTIMTHYNIEWVSGTNKPHSKLIAEWLEQEYEPVCRYCDPYAVWTEWSIISTECATLRAVRVNGRMSIRLAGDDDLEEATWYPLYCPFCGKRITT